MNNRHLPKRRRDVALLRLYKGFGQTTLDSTSNGQTAFTLTLPIISSDRI
ncbi:MAG: hypothetical protein KME54_04035 [Tolypothrix brevis GSE-NOS-MK-07-07A]|nr:hypothetical protein [Tolypothrix brevis GSE-NOS-MK-07-07A]